MKTMSQENRSVEMAVIIFLAVLFSAGTVVELLLALDVEAVKFLSYAGAWAGTSLWVLFSLFGCQSILKEKRLVESWLATGLTLFGTYVSSLAISGGGTAGLWFNAAIWGAMAAFSTKMSRRCVKEYRDQFPAT